MFKLLDGVEPAVLGDLLKARGTARKAERKAAQPAPKPKAAKPKKTRVKPIKATPQAKTAARRIKGKAGLHPEARPVKGKKKTYTALRYVKNIGRKVKTGNTQIATASAEQIKRKLNGAKLWTRVHIEVPGHGPQPGFLHGVEAGGIIAAVVPNVGKTGQAATIRTPDLDDVTVKEHRVTIDPRKLEGLVPAVGSWVKVRAVDDAGRPTTYTVIDAKGRPRIIAPPVRAMLLTDLARNPRQVKLTITRPTSARALEIITTSPDNVLGIWTSRDAMRAVPADVTSFQYQKQRSQSGPAYARIPAEARSAKHAWELQREQVRRHDAWFSHRETPDGKTNEQRLLGRVAGILRRYDLRVADEDDREDLGNIALEEAWKAHARWNQDSVRQSEALIERRAQNDTRRNWFSPTMHGNREDYLQSRREWNRANLPLDKLRDEYIIGQAIQAALHAVFSIHRRGAVKTGKDSMKKFAQARRRLRADYGREPSDVEIAQHLGWKDEAGLPNIERVTLAREEHDFKPESLMHEGEEGEVGEERFAGTASTSQEAEARAEGESRRNALHDFMTGTVAKAAELTAVERETLSYHIRNQLTHESTGVMRADRRKELVAKLHTVRGGKKINEVNIQAVWDSLHHKLRAWAAANPGGATTMFKLAQGVAMEPDTAKSLSGHTVAGHDSTLLHQAARHACRQERAYPNRPLRLRFIKGQCACGSGERHLYQAQSGDHMAPVSVCHGCGKMERVVKRACPCGRLHTIRGRRDGTPDHYVMSICDDCGKVHTHGGRSPFDPIVPLAASSSSAVASGAGPAFKHRPRSGTGRTLTSRSTGSRNTGSRSSRMKQSGMHKSRRDAGRLRRLAGRNPFLVLRKAGRGHQNIVRTPMKDGRVDYGSVNAGEAIWITISDTSSSLHGHHVLITKRADGLFAITGGATHARAKGYFHAALEFGQKRELTDEQKAKIAKYESQMVEHRQKVKEKAKELTEIRQRKTQARTALRRASGVASYEELGSKPKSKNLTEFRGKIEEAVKRAGITDKDDAAYLARNLHQAELMEVRHAGDRQMRKAEAVTAIVSHLNEHLDPTKTDAMTIPKMRHSLRAAGFSQDEVKAFQDRIAEPFGRLDKRRQGKVRALAREQAAAQAASQAPQAQDEAAGAAPEGAAECAHAGERTTEQQDLKQALEQLVNEHAAHDNNQMLGSQDVDVDALAQHLKDALGQGEPASGDQVATEGQPGEAPPAGGEAAPVTPRVKRPPLEKVQDALEDWRVKAKNKKTLITTEDIKRAGYDADEHMAYLKSHIAAERLLRKEKPKAPRLPPVESVQTTPNFTTQGQPLTADEAAQMHAEELANLGEDEVREGVEAKQHMGLRQDFYQAANTLAAASNAGAKAQVNAEAEAAAKTAEANGDDPETARDQVLASAPEEAVSSWGHLKHHMDTGAVEALNRVAAEFLGQNAMGKEVVGSLGVQGACEALVGRLRDEFARSPGPKRSLDAVRDFLSNTSHREIDTVSRALDEQDRLEGQADLIRKDIKPVAEGGAGLSDAEAELALSKNLARQHANVGKALGSLESIGTLRMALDRPRGAVSHVELPMGSSEAVAKARLKAVGCAKYVKTDRKTGAVRASIPIAALEKKVTGIHERTKKETNLIAIGNDTAPPDPKQPKMGRAVMENGKVGIEGMNTKSFKPTQSADIRHVQEQMKLLTHENDEVARGRLTDGERTIRGIGLLQNREVGAGKTLTTLAMGQWLHNMKDSALGDHTNRPVIITCPDANVGGWQEQIREWMGDDAANGAFVLAASSERGGDEPPADDENSAASALAKKRSFNSEGRRRELNRLKRLSKDGKAPKFIIIGHGALNTRTTDDGKRKAYHDLNDLKPLMVAHDEPQRMVSDEAALLGTAGKAAYQMGKPPKVKKGEAQPDWNCARIALTATPATKSTSELYDVGNWVTHGGLAPRSAFIRQAGEIGTGTNYYDNELGAGIMAKMAKHFNSDYSDKSFVPHETNVTVQRTAAQRAKQAEVSQRYNDAVTELKGHLLAGTRPSEIKFIDSKGKSVTKTFGKDPNGKPKKATKQQLRASQFKLEQRRQAEQLNNLYGGAGTRWRKDMKAEDIQSPALRQVFSFLKDRDAEMDQRSLKDVQDKSQAPGGIDHHEKTVLFAENQETQEALQKMLSTLYGDDAVTTCIKNSETPGNSQKFVQGVVGQGGPRFAICGPNAYAGLNLQAAAGAIYVGMPKKAVDVIQSHGRIERERPDDPWTLTVQHDDSTIENEIRNQREAEYKMIASHNKAVQGRQPVALSLPQLTKFDAKARAHRGGD